MEIFIGFFIAIFIITSYILINKNRGLESQLEKELEEIRRI